MSNRSERAVFCTIVALGLGFSVAALPAAALQPARFDEFIGIIGHAEANQFGANILAPEQLILNYTNRPAAPEQSAAGPAASGTSVESPLTVLRALRTDQMNVLRELGLSQANRVNLVEASRLGHAGLDRLRELEMRLSDAQALIEVRRLIALQQASLDRIRQASVPRVAAPRGIRFSQKCSDPLEGERAYEKEPITASDRFQKGSLLLTYRVLTSFGNPDYADGKPIRLHLLGPKYSWPVTGEFDFLDAQTGAGLFFFQSDGIEDFAGLVIEPIKLDLHWSARSIESSKSVWSRALKSLSYGVGIQLFPAGFYGNKFRATGSRPRDISGGEVVLTRAKVAEKSDPVVEKFLAFLARDMESHPEQIRGISPALLRRARSLVKGVKIDLDAPLQPEDE